MITIALVDETDLPLDVSRFSQKLQPVTNDGPNDFSLIRVPSTYESLFAFRGLIGMAAAESLPHLRAALNLYGAPNLADNLLDPEPGNVSHVLDIMVKWAERHPDAMWVDGEEIAAQMGAMVVTG